MLRLLGIALFAWLRFQSLHAKARVEPVGNGRLGDVVVASAASQPHVCLVLSRICFRFCSVLTLDAVVASDPPHCWSLVVLAYRCAPVVATFVNAELFLCPCPLKRRFHVERLPLFLWDEEQVRVPSLLRHSRCAPASLLVVCW